MRFHIPLHGIGAAALLIVLVAAIMPSAVLPFIVAQLVGALLAVLLSRWIFIQRST